MNYQLLHDTFVLPQLKGRYITNKHIEPLLESFKSTFEVAVAGTSLQQKPIYSIRVGSGIKRIFIWSQMHGNESTTTKAIFDFLNFLKSNDKVAQKFREQFTFYILPIVNPDGAELYTRENAAGIDLNRDSLNLSQPESKILRKAFEDCRPHYCYNMHDQRTIFGVGDEPKPATVSFLAPSYNEARDINSTRQQAINIITAMNAELQKYIPGQVGRFDDSFNINCIGDMFQSLGVPTILFEAGHYQGDYEREVSRRIIFFALIKGFIEINENVLANDKNNNYFNIPQNKIIFYDVIYKKLKINYENKEIITNFASQYKEVLFEKSVKFQAIIKEIGNLENYHAHSEFDCRGCEFTDEEGNTAPVIDKKADFYLSDGRIFRNGLPV